MNNNNVSSIEIATDEALVRLWQKKTLLRLMTPEELLIRIRKINEKYRVRRQIREN